MFHLNGIPDTICSVS